jgi:sigma-E factor negative regulatory protein RseC
VIEEEGIIVGFKNGRALVKTERSAACNSCGSIEICQPSDRDKENIVEAENSLGAREGDKVIIAVEAGELLKTSMMIYLFPLSLFVFGVLFGESVGDTLVPGMDKDIFSIMFGIFMLVVAFAGIRTYYSNKKEIGQFTFPKIIRILS